MDWNEFHRQVGRTMMYCQTIEHDIRYIYAGMLSGDMDKNLALIAREKMTLGTVLKSLDELDHSDGKPLFSASDYELLRRVTGIRNHWAHEGYTAFIYSDGDEEYLRQAARLKRDSEMLEGLYKTIEQVRIKVLKLYGRI